MKAFVLLLSFVVNVWFNPTLSIGQQRPDWLLKEFSQEPVPVTDVQNFLNETCHTSGLDGIQLLAVQPGHDQTMHLHVYCRPDQASQGHYSVTMVPIPDRNPDKAVKPFLGNPDARVGPFYFGKDGEPDGVLIVEIEK
jgi:hypothetical protein